MSALSGRIPSPCVKICQMDATMGLCIGCRRTLQEIADWLDMTPAQQLSTLQHVAERRRRLGESSETPAV